MDLHGCQGILDGELLERTLTDARAPEQGDRESTAPHHDLPRDAARPVQRTRIRDAMSAARMAPVVNDPWIDLREDSPTEIPRSRWGTARTTTASAEATAASRPKHDHVDAVIDLTDESDTAAPDSPMPPERAVVELGRRQSSPTAAGAELAPRAHYGLGPAWGSKWGTSTQGWVRAQDGTVVWRPIVTTTEHLDLWDIDRYLGVVTAEVAARVEHVDDQSLGTMLARAREIGVQGLVSEAVERGAHGVIGVTLDYTPLGSRVVVTLTGTAVTLREKRSS